MRKWVAGAVVAVLAGAGATLAAGQETPADGREPKPRVEKKERTRQRIERTPELRRLAVLGDRGVRIGVSVRDVEGEQAPTPGAVISGVREESPAARAGLQAGDIVQSFDGERIRSARQLSRVVSETPAGRTVEARVLRDGKPMTFQVTPEAGAEPFAFSWRDGDGPMAALEFAPGFRFDPKEFRGSDRSLDDLAEEARKWRGEGRDFDVFVAPAGRARLGLTLESVTPQLAEYFGAERGVLVSSVAPESPAARAGLRAGDVITGVGETPVASPVELARAVRAAEDGAELTIAYVRDKKQATTRVVLEAARKPAPPGKPI